MACVYIHDDYNAIEDGFFVVKGKAIHPTKPKVTLYGKFFRFLPNIWVYLDEDTSLVNSNKESSCLLDNDYCNTSEKKSLYLQQLNVLFKRLNTIPTGQKLLKCLSTYRPLNEEYKSEKSLINKNNFIIDSNTKKQHYFNLLIVPPRGYMQNTARNLFDKDDNNIYKGPLFGHSSIIHFVPNVLNVYKINNKIIYEDPVLALAFLLIGALHAIVSLDKVLLLLNHSDYPTVEKQFIDGVNDIKDLNSKEMRLMYQAIENRLISTAEVLNLSNDEPSIKDNFATQFYLTKQNNKYIYENKNKLSLFFTTYIDINLKCICRDFNIQSRSSYKDLPVYKYEINAENKHFYTIDKGLNLNNIQQLKAHDAYVNYFSKVYNKTIDKVYKG